MDAMGRDAATEGEYGAMKARIVERKWVVPWFDERQCYHMPSLTMAANGNLLAVWNGGFLQWNGDPMGRDAKDWVSVLEPGAQAWSNPDAVGCDIRYCCHDPVFIKNRRDEIILLYAKFLDTEVNFSTWCNGRDELWMRKTRDGGRTWEPARPANIQSGHASNDSVLLPDGTIVFASTSSEMADKYFGAVRIYRSCDDGETWEKGPLLWAEDGNLIREPALCLRPGGVIRMFTRTCPGATGWGDGIRSLASYTAESRDGGRTWTKPEPAGILNNESKIDVLSWDDETILMAYNDTPVADWHERSPLTLACSRDEGRPGRISWSLRPRRATSASPPCAGTGTGGSTWCICTAIRPLNTWSWKSRRERPAEGRARPLKGRALGQAFSPCGFSAVCPAKRPPWRLAPYGPSVRGGCLRIIAYCMMSVPGMGARSTVSNPRCVYIETCFGLCVSR